MALFKPIETYKANLDSIPILSGQIIYCTDVAEVYHDTSDGVRIQTGDVIYLNTEADRTTMIAPIREKLYIVRETGLIYRYNPELGQWVKAVDTIDSQDIWNDSMILKVKTLKQGDEYIAPRTLASIVLMNDKSNVQDIISAMVNDFTTLQGNTYTKVQIDDMINEIENNTNLTNYATKDYVTNSIAAIPGPDLSGYMEKVVEEDKVKNLKMSKTLTTVGWYRVLKIDLGVGNIRLATGWNTSASVTFSNIDVTVAGGNANDAKFVVTASGAANKISKIRIVRDVTGSDGAVFKVDKFLEIYCENLPTEGEDVYVYANFTGKSNVQAIDFTPITANPVFIINSLDLSYTHSGSVAMIGYTRATRSGVSAGDDLNNMIHDNEYIIEVNCLNTPNTTTAHYGKLCVFNYSNGWVTQEFYAIDGNSPYIQKYIRQMRVGVWTPWELEVTCYINPITTEQKATREGIQEYLSNIIKTMPSMSQKLATIATGTSSSPLGGGAWGVELFKSSNNYWSALLHNYDTNKPLIRIQYYNGTYTWKQVTETTI